jgi:hypothetical protein
VERKEKKTIIVKRRGKKEMKRQGKKGARS